MLNDNRLNSRKFWNTIKSISSNKSKTSSPRAENTNQRAKNFVRYFSMVVSFRKKPVYPLIDIVSRNPKKSKLRTKSIFTFAYVSSIFVEKEFRNKSVGADCLPPNLFKVCAREIASPISFIINKSLETSTVPNEWNCQNMFNIQIRKDWTCWKLSTNLGASCTL